MKKTLISIAIIIGLGLAVWADDPQPLPSGTFPTYPVQTWRSANGTEIGTISQSGDLKIAGRFISGNTPITGGGGGSSEPSGVTNVSAAYTANTNYTVIVADTTAAAFAIRLPSVFSPGLFFQIKNVGTNTLTITNSLGQTIDGALSVDLATQYQARTLYRISTNWFIY